MRLRACLLVLAGFLLSFNAFSARVPLYATYSGSFTDWFYTTNAYEKNLAVSYGYSDFGILAYCEDQQVSGTSPLKRFYNGPPATDHFYTIQQSEVDIVSAYGWVYEGTECYFYNSQVPDSTPVYRLSYADGSGDFIHRFTTAAWERDAIILQGWAYDGVAGYVFAQSTPAVPTCSSGFASPTSIYPGQTAALTLICSGTVTSYTYRMGPPSPSGPQFGQSTQPVIVGPLAAPGQYGYEGIACNSQGCSSPLTIVVTVVPNPNAPVLVQAATFTASCADRYCIRLTGFNFASNSRVDLWQGSTFIGSLSPTLRTTNGEANVVEVTLIDPNLRNALDVEAPKFNVAVVNPGVPDAYSTQLQVLRATTNTVTGWVDSYSTPSLAPINATQITGWACFFGSPAIPIRIHEGTIAGPIIGNPKADQPGNATVAQLCGGNGNRYFTFRWPDKYRDGQPRRFYVTADIHLIMNAVPNDVLIGNSPITVTLPNVPRRAEYVSIQVPVEVGAGTSFLVQVTFRNIGSVPWTKNESYALGSTNPLSNNTWATTRVPLPTDTVNPGQSTTFSFNVVAPTIAGNYNMQWSMLQENVDWFGDLTSNRLITVLSRTTPNSNVGPQPTIPNLNSPLPYAVNPPNDPILALPPTN